MRILLVTCGLRYGGAERIIEALAIDLAAKGDQVHVVATTRGGPVQEVLRTHHIPVSVLHLGSALDARVPLKLAMVARKFAPDIVHSHLAVADIAAASARPMLRRHRLITTVHNPGVELGWWKLALWRTALLAFDRVIAVSETVHQALSPRCQAEIQRPSLVRLDAHGMSKEEARRQIGVHELAPLVVAVGRLTPVKGFDVLAEAARHLPADVRMLIVGDGPERARLAAEPRLELRGELLDVTPVLAAADVVVCPSRSEGFPQVPLQAFALRVPVIGTAVPGLAAIIQDQVTGRLVPPEDPVALAKAISEMLLSKAQCRVMGEAGHQWLIQEGLTREAMIERTRRTYQTLLDSPRPRTWI